MDWQGPKEAAKGNQHMLAGNWKCNYNLEKGKLHCAHQNDVTLVICMMSLLPKKGRIPFPACFYASYLVHPQSYKTGKERKMSFEYKGVLDLELNFWVHNPSPTVHGYFCHTDTLNKTILIVPQLSMIQHLKEDKACSCWWTFSNSGPLYSNKIFLFLFLIIVRLIKGINHSMTWKITIVW